MQNPRIRVLGRDEVLHRAIFRWFSVRFNYIRFDGTESGTVEHLVLDRGDSVGMLLHDVEKNEVIFVEQLRIATVDSGTGWLLECPAGRVDPGEEPNHTARREAREETGAEPHEIKLISSFYLSPGGCSERLHLFYCPFQNGVSTLATAGLKEENEDIRVHRIPLDTALAMIENGEIADAKTIVGLLWLQNSILTKT